MSGREIAHDNSVICAGSRSPSLMEPDSDPLS